jgi:light-regulated signal transduction histidine kinase (bacteriophytochrome)
LTGWPARYGLALGAVALATVVSIALAAAHAPGSVVLFIYLVAIMATSWVAGFGPGVLATLTSSVIGPYIVDHHLTLARIDPVRVLLFLAASLLVSRIAEGRAKAEAALRAVNSALDERVRARTEDLRRANDALRGREADLLRQADDLQRSNAELSRFAYIASHDMQEPLRMIGIYAEILQRDHARAMNADGQQFLRVVLDGAARLQRLVKDLLDYSRMTERSLDALSPTDLNEVVRVAKENLAQVIAETGATVHVRQLPTVPCDAVQLMQVFQNLLGNALKYRHRDRTPEIEVSADRGADTWMFTVRDNGIGIRPEYKDRVFEPFKRLHGREIPGTGVGLAICKRIIERHGGRAWVDSAEGLGAAFKFTLPVVHDGARPLEPR